MREREEKRRCNRVAAWGNREVIQLLLDAGADPTIPDANKHIPLSYARWKRDSVVNSGPTSARWDNESKI